MNKVWSDNAWDEYLSWQSEDRKTLKRINALIKDIERHPFEGLGKPELLKYDKQGYWSRRIIVSVHCCGFYFYAYSFWQAGGLDTGSCRRILPEISGVNLVYLSEVVH